MRKHVLLGLGRYMIPLPSGVWKRGISKSAQKAIGVTSMPEEYHLVRDLEDAGYRVIVSIGEVEENYIGSNCGQYVRRHLEAGEHIQGGYTYSLQEIE